MRIAMLGLKGIPLGASGGGIERHVEELAVRLARRGHRVYVYVRSYTLEGKRARVWHGVHLISLPTIRSKNLETIVHTFLATLHVLFLPVDVIHYHGVGPSVLSIIPRIFQPFTKVVVTFHAIDRFHAKWGFFARGFLRFGEWAAMHFPNKTIVVSHTLRVYVHRNYGKPGIYIPNGVESKPVRKINEIAKFGLRRKGYFVTVARLIKNKGIHYLIQAFRGLKTEKKLVIVGAPSFSDDYVEYLAKIASDDPRIIFTGYQKGEVLEQLYAHAFAYVHPSEFEGLSVSILEAMSYATPVLISEIPENLEAVDHSGFSFKPRHVQDLKSKMVYLLTNQKIAEQMGRKGRAFVRKFFSWKKIIEKTEEVYAGKVVGDCE